MSGATIPGAQVADFLVPDSAFHLFDSMLGAEDLPATLQQVTDTVRATLNAEGATIYLVLPDTQELEAQTRVHNVPRLIRVPINDRSLAGYCAVSGRAFVIPDAYGDLSGVYPGLRFDHRWDEAHSFRTRDVLCAPAVCRGETVGVVQAVNHRQSRFTELDLAAARTVGRFVGYALAHARMVEDISTLKQLQRQKAEFMQIMVHELKSPVAAARMMAELLRQGLVPPADHPGHLSRLVGRLDQMLELVRDTLNLSRVTSGTPLSEIRVLDLVGVVGEVAGRYRDEATTKALQFTVRLSDVPLPVRLDGHGLELIISNLVSNAVKYTAKGEVEVTATRAASHAVLGVRDTGMGIPAADMPRMFREFYRASNARRSAVQGSGVGLAGVKHLVDRFGGELRLETEENRGSSFEVRLPLCEG